MRKFVALVLVAGSTVGCVTRGVLWLHLSPHRRPSAHRQSSLVAHARCPDSTSATIMIAGARGGPGYRNKGQASRHPVVLGRSSGDPDRGTSGTHPVSDAHCRHLAQTRHGQARGASSVRRRRDGCAPAPQVQGVERRRLTRKGGFANPCDRSPRPTGQRTAPKSFGRRDRRASPATVERQPALADVAVVPGRIAGGAPAAN